MTARSRDVAMIIMLCYDNNLRLYNCRQTAQSTQYNIRHDGSNDADSRKDVPFWDFFHITSHLGGQKNPKPQFRGLNRRFQAKLAKSKNVHIRPIKTTSSIPTKLSWVVPTHALQNQGGGRPPSWKNRKIVITQPRFERF